MHTQNVDTYASEQNISFFWESVGARWLHQGESNHRDHMFVSEVHFAIETKKKKKSWSFLKVEPRCTLHRLRHKDYFVHDVLGRHTFQADAGACGGRAAHKRQLDLIERDVNDLVDVFLEKGGGNCECHNMFVSEMSCRDPAGK
jgi:hypothetical protein